MSNLFPPLAKMAHSYISSGKEDLEIKYNTFEVEGDYKTSLLKTLSKKLKQRFQTGLYHCRCA